MRIAASFTFQLPPLPFVTRPGGVPAMSLRYDEMDPQFRALADQAAAHGAAVARAETAAFYRATNRDRIAESVAGAVLTALQWSAADLEMPHPARVAVYAYKLADAMEHERTVNPPPAPALKVVA